MKTDRSRPFEIAADLEAAAMAAKEARMTIWAVHSSVWKEINDIAGIEHLDDTEIERALFALRDKYQAIADAEPDGPECPSSPTGRHIVDTTMESGPSNCFHCERSMP